ncbi:MAG: hypothetical protein NVSMB13_03890 [Mycobacteriales bacterium]
MTVVALAVETGAEDATPATPAHKRRDIVSIAEHQAVLAALLWWALPMTHRLGGRGPGAVSGGLLLMVPALLLVQPWRRLPVRWSALALSVPIAAFGVCLVAPTGWYGANDAAAYAYACLLGLVVLAYARTATRRLALAALICLAGLEQFTQAFLPWWGGSSPTRSMSGTFYWHNPYAAFLLAPALLGVALAVGKRSPWRLVGWVSAPLCAAGIALSTSRATMACLVVGWSLIGSSLLIRTPRRSPFLRWLAVSGLAVTALFVLTGPPFFSHRSSPLAATADRTVGQSLEANGSYRTEFWREALAVGSHHPVAGGGFQSLALASDGLVPFGWARSPLAHSGYLQAWSDGGLLLGLPVLALVLAVAGGLLRRLAAVPRQTLDPGALGFGVPVAALALMAHSAVDFDWSRPALLSMTALVAVVGLAGGSDSSVTSPGSRWGRLGAAGGCAIVLVIAITAAYAWDGSSAALARPYRQQTPAAAAELLIAGAGPLSDYRLAARVLDLATAKTPMPESVVPPALVRRAIGATAAAAVVDRRVALRRAQALAQLGQRDDAVVLARTVLSSVGPAHGPYAADVARVLAAAGDLPGARRLLLSELRADLAPAGGGPGLWTHTAALLEIEGRSDDLSRCAYTAASRLQPVPPNLAASGQNDSPAGVDCDTVLSTAEEAR